MRRRRASRAYSIQEMLVCISLIALVLSMAFVVDHAFGRSGQLLTCCVDDVMDATLAGERWREDLRSATGEVTLKDGVLSIPQKKRAVVYRLHAGRVLRSTGGRDAWAPVIRNAKASRMVHDVRHGVASWRWELELRTRAREPRVRPLFTFRAVPGRNATRGK